MTEVDSVALAALAIGIISVSVVVSILILPLAMSGTTPRTVSNVERWEWTDYLGQKRQLVIHREVKA